MENENKNMKKNMICYPLGTVGRDAVYSLINSYLLTYVLFTHSLDAAQLFAITAIMVAARVFDALNDPIMGNIIERTRSKFGKFKPWLLAGGLSTSVVIYLMFNVRLQGWSFVWFFGLMYFAFSITYTMSDISYWGMIPALGSDADARNRFTSRATLFAGIGGTLASILIPMLTAGTGAIGGSTATAYGWVALAIAILSPLFILFVLFGVQEHREEKPQDLPREKFSLIQVFKTIARNDQLVWIAVIFLVQQVGNGLVIGGLGSTYIYFTFGYSGGLYSLFTTVGMSATAVLMILYPVISRRITRKKLMGIMSVISVVGYVMMLVCAAIPGNGMGKFGLLVVGYMLSNFGQYCFYLIMMISIMNTVEYNEYRFGVRDEGIITSLRPFITKMGSALIVALTFAIYLIFGVTGYTNQISELEQQCAQGLISEEQKLAEISGVIFGSGQAEGVTSLQSTGLLIAMTIVPCALMLISYFLYKKKYKLDEEEYDRICGELNAKRGQG
ncbi:MAG: glycoside-pentoside-hexuronide (GPH):cation symporter [Roseburia sp.]|nr:glycoside-pentoside-hexuronide (GPH):cation symporter [Roseburia sp.]MCM1099150.1 glycoside-pentoside-hexuronide (GPH):cation symporter [Ruminococcus flavefaciens]